MTRSSRRRVAAALHLSLAVLLAAAVARAGDPPAHTAAMIDAAATVQALPAFTQGVGAPFVNGVAAPGRFKIPVPPDLLELQCPLDHPIVFGVGCAYADVNGFAVNEPDDWACLDGRQPPQITLLNAHLAPLQTAFLQAIGHVKGTEIACNYNHFAINAPGVPTALDAARTTLGWAGEIPTFIERGGAHQNGLLGVTLACDAPTFDLYYSRVANALHYVQDAQTEHHAIGNEVCLPQDFFPAFTQVGTIPRLGALPHLRLSPCGRFLASALVEMVGPLPLVSCDEELVFLGLPTFNVDTLAVLCAGGASLACSGLERLLRHHCNVDRVKTLVCSGPADDHRNATDNRQYCEGEIFSTPGTQDFLTLAESASVPVLAPAMARWASVCKEPDDPCVPAACDVWCKRSKLGALAGFCTNPAPDPTCVLHQCTCAPDTACGTLDQPCCPGPAATACGPGLLCGKATGTCVQSTDVCCTPVCDALRCGQADGCGGTCGCGPDKVCNEAVGLCVPPPTSLAAVTWGDPHLVSWDGTHYDFQMVGEFILMRDDTGFEIQTRQAPYGTSRAVAINVAVAIRLGQDRIVIRAGAPAKVAVNGGPLSTVTDLQLGAGTLHFDGTQYLIVAADGHSVAVAPRGLYLNLVVRAPSPAVVSGLLGDRDASMLDDFRTRDGAVLVRPLAFADLYGTFADAWRISDAESLFDYGPDESTATFTDRTFPGAVVSVADLAPAVYESAKAQCLASGVTQPTLLLDCIYDVGMTGDVTFATDFTTLPRLTTPDVPLDSGFAPGAMALNGSATLFGSRVRLNQGGVQAGSAFYPAPVDVRAFTTEFDLQMLALPNVVLGDGITFTIQGNSPRALGSAGGFLGYAGIPKSVALKFDTFNNAGEGVNSTGVYTGGASPFVPAVTIGGGVDLHSGHVLRAAVTYDGAILTLTLTDTLTLASFTTSFAVDIAAAVGGSTAFVGFTGGMAGTGVTQDVLRWRYDAATATGAGGCVATAGAGRSVVVNGGFEAPVVPAGSAQVFATGSTGIPGWTVVGAPGNVAPLSTTFTQGGILFAAQEGVQSLDLTGITNTATGISQAIPTTPGASYCLSFWVGNALGGIFGTTSTVNVQIDSSQVLQATNSASTPGGINWKQFDLPFTATASSTVISFINGDTAADNSNLLDNVSVR